MLLNIVKKLLKNYLKLPIKCLSLKINTTLFFQLVSRIMLIQHLRKLSSKSTKFHNFIGRHHKSEKQNLALKQKVMTQMRKLPLTKICTESM